MTLDEAVADLLALRDRLPAQGPSAELARDLMDQLETAGDSGQRRQLVDRLLNVLRDIAEVSADAETIYAGIYPPATAPAPVEAPAPPPPRPAPEERSSAPIKPRLSPGRLWSRVMRRGNGGRRGAPRAEPPMRNGGGDEAAREPEPIAAAPALIERNPHLEVDAPSPIRVGARFDVSVYLDTEALGEGEHGAPVVLPALDELSIEVTLTTSDHFAIDGPERAELVVRASEDRSTTATFALECVRADAGRPGIAAAFACDWRPVGSVWRDLEVEGAQPPPADELRSLPEPALAADPRARAADLVVRILQSPDGDDRHFDVIVASPHLDAYRQGVKASWRLPAGTREYVAGFMQPFLTTDPGGRKAALIGAGKELFRATPPEFQAAVWALVDGGHEGGSIFVATSEPFIPWELMIPNDDARERPALGAEFSVGRWVHPQHVAPEQAMPIVDSYVIAPNYVGDERLGFSAEEARYVIEAFKGTPISPAFMRTIDATLGARGATLLHMICHGVDAPGGQVLKLDPDEELYEIQLEGIPGVVKAVREQRPFVFINACEVGRPQPSLVGTGGFAARFTRLGARCVIAPIWSVKDSVAGVVARDFYERVRKEPTVPYARILRDIRARSYQGDDPEDSYAAYCFYGDPLAAASG
jgi:hypothetical protein